MTLFEAISSSLQSRSATAAALSERVTTPPAAAAAAPPVAQTQMQDAVQQPSAMQSARMMMENRAGAGQPHVPMQGRTTLSSGLSAGAMTAAYLTEMRLTQELEALQDELSK